MDDLKIRLVLEGAEQVQSGANKAADGLKKLGDQGQRAGEQASLSGHQMAQVSAQLQDLFVQIQGGQAPITALLQQGSQLSSVFGGASNALKAVGGFVGSLVTPLTLAGAAAVTLGYGFLAGAAQSEALRKSVILTGAAAGASADQLQNMADRLSSVAGSQAKAAEALAAFVESTDVGVERLERFAKASIDFERAGGTAVSELVKNFAELGKDPLAALQKLDERTHFLTASVYEQVKALKDQGRETEAAAKAQEAYASMLEDRAPTMAKNLGLIARLWRDIKDAAAGAVSSIQGIGRDDTLAEQIKKVELQIKVAQTRAQLRPGVGYLDMFLAGRAANEAKELEQVLVKLRESQSVGEQIAAAAAKRNDQEEARVKWLNEGDKYLDKQKLAEREIDLIRQHGLEAGASALEIEQRIAVVRAKSADTGGQNELAGLRAKLKETNLYIDALTRQDASTRQLNDGERTAQQLREQLLGTLSSTTRAEKQQALALAEKLGVRQRLAEGLKADIEANDRFTAQLGDQTDATRQRAIDQAAANAVMGKGRTAIEEMTLAQLRKSAADLEATDNVDPKYLAGLYARIDAQKLYIGTLRDTDYKTIAAGLDEWNRSAAEQLRLMEGEQQLSGLTRLEREKLVAARQVELKLAKELADIDRADLDDARKEALRLKARGAAQIETNAATAKAVLDEWTRTSDQIEQSLTDALLRGFESGKGFAVNLRDTLVNLFKTLVLRPIIQPIASSAAGGLASLLGLPGSASASTASSLVGGGSSLGSLGSLLGLGNLGSAFGGGFGLTMSGAGGTSLALEGAGALLGNGAYMQGLAQGAGALAPWALGGLAGLYGGRAISGGYSAVGSSGNAAVNIGTLAGALFGGPLGAAVGGAIGGVVNRAFGMKAKEAGESGIEGTATMSGFAGDAYAKWTQKGGWFRSDKSGTDRSAISTEQDAVLDAGIQALYKSTAEYAKVLGLPLESINGYAASFKVAWGKTDEDNQKAIQTAMIGLGDQLAARYATQLAPLQKAGETLAATLSRLSTLQVFSNTLNSLGGVFSKIAGASVTAREHLIELAGGMDALGQQALGFAQNYYNRDEIAGMKAKDVQAALSSAGITADLGSREQFRALVESLDPSTDTGAKQLAALLSLQGSFATVADYLTESGLTLNQAAALAPASDLLSPLLSTTSQQLQLAQQSMDAQIQTRDATLQMVGVLQRLTSAILGSGGAAAPTVPGYRQPEVTLAP